MILGYGIAIAFAVLSISAVVKPALHNAAQARIAAQQAQMDKLGI